MAFLFLIPGYGEAQNVFSPGFHFGELNVPDLVEKFEFGLHLDRFTEFGKPRWSGCDDQNEVFANDRKKYGLRDSNKVTFDPVALDKTMGFNLLGLSYQKRISKLGRPSVRIFSILGVTHDQPTEILQNWFMHDVIFDLFGDPACDVPTKKTLTQPEVGVGFEANWWANPISKWVPIFGGVGATGGTIHQEIFAQAGVKIECKCGGVSLMGRAGATAPGRAFKGSSIAGNYRAMQASAVLRLNRVSKVLPDVELGQYRTNGWLLTQGGERIDERLIFANFSWANGAWTAELSNDKGAGDWGPTFGFRFQAHVTKLKGFGRAIYKKIGLI